MSSSQIFILHDRGSHDLNATSFSSVSTSHLSDHLLNLTVQGNVTVLLVHIVGIGSGVVSQPDSVVVNFSRVLFEDFYLSQNFSSGFLLFVDTFHEVPEFGSLQNSVLSEDSTWDEKMDE